MRATRAYLCDASELEEPEHPQHLDRLKALSLRAVGEDEGGHLKRDARDEVDYEPTAQVSARDLAVRGDEGVAVHVRHEEGEDAVENEDEVDDWMRRDSNARPSAGCSKRRGLEFVALALIHDERRIESGRYQRNLVRCPHAGDEQRAHDQEIPPLHRARARIE